MVTSNHIVKSLLLLFALIAMSNPVHASPELQASVSRSQLQLGKSLELHLFSPQSTVSLDNLELNALKTDFHIQHIGDINLQNNSQSQRITLYPRKTGVVLIPDLHFINTRTSPIEIKVTPARDPKDNSVLDVAYSVSTLAPWKKQQVLVKLELTGQAPVLRLNIPNAYSNHSDIISLAHSTEVIKKDNKMMTRHLTGWAVFPRQAGQKEIELPAVQMVRDGVTTHQFYPPLLNLQVKQLPVYIPVTMPVGKLKFMPTQPAARFMLTDKIYSTGLTINASGIIPSALPSIASQFKSSAAISFYPATVDKQQQNNSTDISTQHNYAINYKSHQQGALPLGSIKLNYFDPGSGTIRTAQYDSGKAFSLNTSIAILISIFLVLFSYLLLAKVISYLVIKWRCFLAYKHILSAIPDMQNAGDIKNALNRIAQAENWHNNLTLQQWHEQWLDKMQSPCPVNINQLELGIYAGKEANVDQLTRGIQAICLHRWSLLKLFEPV